MTQLRAKEKAQLRDSTWWQMMVHVTVSVFRVVNLLKLLLTSPCGKVENLTCNIYIYSYLYIYIKKYIMFFINLHLRKRKTCKYK